MYPPRRKISGPEQTPDLPPSVQKRGPSRQKDGQIGACLKMATVWFIHFGKLNNMALQHGGLRGRRPAPSVDIKG